MIEIEALKKIHFLKELPGDILEKIGSVAQLETVDKESVLVKQDQTLDTVYMLAFGKIFLNCRASSGKALTLDELSPGQSFGVSAFIGESLSSFTAICAEKSSIITLPANQMIQLCEKDYKLGYTFMQQVVQTFKSRMDKHTRQFIHSLATHPDMV